MKFPESVFIIIEDHQCPLYKLGDEFRLSGKALVIEHEEEKKFITTAIVRSPVRKPECRILAGDIANLLIKYGSVDKIPLNQIKCGGCTGFIRLEHQSKKAVSTQPLSQAVNDSDKMAKLLRNFSIFQTLEEQQIKQLLPFFKLKRLSKDTVILKKGDPAKDFYIILSGRVEVLEDDGMLIASLGKGEVFGEMSLLSGDPVGATVKVAETLMVLCVSGKKFRSTFNTIPSLQVYFARLLTRRLARSNTARSEELSSGMVGKLSDLPPSELYQTLKSTQKTGVLTLTLSQGPAKISFRNGDPVNVLYNRKKGKEAFFDTLKERDGRFRFTPGLTPEEENLPEMGNFMWLLMEGLRRIDEESGETGDE